MILIRIAYLIQWIQIKNIKWKLNELTMIAKRSKIKTETDYASTTKPYGLSVY